MTTRAEARARRCLRISRHSGAVPRITSAASEGVLERRLPRDRRRGHATRLLEAMRYSTLGRRQARAARCWCTPRAKSLRVRRCRIARRTRGSGRADPRLFSLVHDDLPAMDDDDLRRGRPTCHKRLRRSHRDSRGRRAAGSARIRSARECPSGNDRGRHSARLRNACASWPTPSALNGMAGGQAHRPRIRLQQKLDRWPNGRSACIARKTGALIQRERAPGCAIAAGIANAASANRPGDAGRFGAVHRPGLPDPGRHPRCRRRPRRRAGQGAPAPIADRKNKPTYPLGSRPGGRPSSAAQASACAATVHALAALEPLAREDFAPAGRLRHRPAIS